MVTTDKDFENLPTKDHPRTYYFISTDSKPTTNVINGAVGIEIDTSKIYFFNKGSSTWVEFGDE